MTAVCTEKPPQLPPSILALIALAILLLMLNLAFLERCSNVTR